MRRSATWGLIVVVFGVLLLLQNLGYLDFLGISVWQILWPLALIGIGVGFLLGSRGGKYVGESREFAVDLEGSTEANIELNYGAGELRVTGGAPESNLLSGLFEGGLEEHVGRGDGPTRVRLSSRSAIYWPWQWSPAIRRRWTVRLTDQVPLELVVKTGASDCHLDLEALRVTRLHLESGASSTEVTLPARAGHTEVSGSSGAASVVFRVPEGVAARIHTHGGLASFTVNHRRFPREGGVYQSPDYETADNRIDLQFEMGLGSVDVR